VYAPYQISNLLQADYRDFKSGNPVSLFYALDQAVKHPERADLQSDALDAMAVFVEEIRAEVEFYREQRLKPVVDQEKALLAAIDRSYTQVHYANSIVAGHLASVVKVYDAQEKLLQEFGMEGLRPQIGQTLARTSEKVAMLVEEAKKIDVKSAKMEVYIDKFTRELDKIIKDLKTPEK
ncbi:MAG: hypothetical protein JRJ04_16950, partial [Deltaproteobacteria bacterium]|nr:hypothetical protein [Deltaproteobacteria bacterium]